MPGYVRAHLENHFDGSYDVMPTACPATEEDKWPGMRCFTRHADGWQRMCCYFISTTENDNLTARAHPSHFQELGAGDGMAQIRCGVLCGRQRSNRPPGC